MSESGTETCKQEAGVFAPVINLARCEGKAGCVRVCPENVFEVRRIEDGDFAKFNVLQRLKLRLHGMKVSYTPNRDACKACGLCVSACPEDAITLARRAPV